MVVCTVFLAAGQDLVAIRILNSDTGMSHVESGRVRLSVVHHAVNSDLLHGTESFCQKW